MQLIIGTKKYINNILNTYNFNIIKNEYNKPLDKNNNIYFNKSHTDDLSVAIIDNNPCGIDIEYIREYNNLMALKICSKEEYSFLQSSNNKDYYFTLLWILKESYLKCLGIGISIPLKEISFIKDNNIINNIGEYKFNIINYTNHIISICRKD